MKATSARVAGFRITIEGTDGGKLRVEIEAEPGTGGNPLKILRRICFEMLELTEQLAPPELFEDREDAN